MEPLTPAYRAVMTIAGPIVRRWGRLEVVGTELLTDGPLLLLGTHDSYWDPVVVGVAGREHRQIRALAKSTLWKFPLLGPVLNGMGQIPIKRGKGDARALEAAIAELRGGACIGVFPEGTMSRGRYLRPRSGAGRLAEAVPEALVLGVAITGVVDIVRFPKRPTMRVEIFQPRGGVRLQPGETAAQLAERVIVEARERAPIQIPGRRRTAAKYLARQQAEAATAAAAQSAGAGDQPAPVADRVG
ncbi:MAG: lysophospholipid acyltransferase family protein [Solirubrobacteraceae bacterium]